MSGKEMQGGKGIRACQSESAEWPDLNQKVNRAKKQDKGIEHSVHIDEAVKAIAVSPSVIKYD